MSRGDGIHSFGHGSSCYYCGLDDDSPEIEKPCDERVRKQPTEATMRAYRKREALGEDVCSVAFEYGAGIIEWDVMMQRIAALDPKAKKRAMPKRGTP